ncbi:MAG: hypothetical protein ACO2OR_05250 [Desulfurococcaceae archaeon]
MGCTLFSLSRLPRRVDELEDIKAHVEALGRNVAELKKNVKVMPRRSISFLRGALAIGRQAQRRGGLHGRRCL